MIADSLKRKWCDKNDVSREWLKYRVIDKPFYPYFLLNESSIRGQVKADHKRKLPLDPVTIEKKAKYENDPVCITSNCALKKNYEHEYILVLVFSFFFILFTSVERFYKFFINIFFTYLFFR